MRELLTIEKVQELINNNDFYTISKIFRAYSGSDAGFSVKSEEKAVRSLEPQTLSHIVTMISTYFRELDNNTARQSA